MAIKARPAPRSSSRLSHVVVAQPVISGQNQYISPAAMIANISLLTGGEAIKLRNRFQGDFPFLVFLWAAGLAALLFLGIVLLYLHGCGENYWPASSLLVEEPPQRFFDFGINEACFFPKPRY